ncbi:hypothetical protein K6V92_01135 [Cupriavidus respiraculi]|nr:hypothetical protein [Cupriavidus respiraculi]
MDTGEGFKEVCAHYGAAMYFAQVLEHGIANSLLFIDLIPRTRGKWSPDEYDDFFAQHFDKTLGNLIRALKGVCSLPAELEACLREANSRRSFLAHNFFRERIDAIQLGKFKEIVESLESDRGYFEKANQALEQFIEPLMKRYGFTAERLQRALEEYKTDLSRPRSSSEKD